MSQTRIKPMVEGGILAAIAVILALGGVYLPLLGSVIILLWPVPIVLLGVRQGLKWSIMATLVAGILIAGLADPFSAVSIVMTFGLMGIVLGYALRLDYRPLKTLFWGSAATLLSYILIILLLGYLVMGANPFAVQTYIDMRTQLDTTINTVGEQTIAIYRQLGVGEAELANMSNMYQTIIAIMKRIFPAAMVLAAISVTYLNYAFSRLVLRKLGRETPSLPPFRHWQASPAFAYLLVVGYLMIYWGQTRNWDLLYAAGLNIQAVSGFPLLICGLALFYYFADKYRLSRFTVGLILVLMLSSLPQVLTIFGAVDAVVDYRRLRPLRSS